MQVLVVDDNEDNVDLVCDILADDFELITASDGEECLEVVRNNKPDLILLDVHMPKMDGYTVLKTLQADPKNKDIPVIFLTARYRDPDRIVSGLEMGAFDYITKPVEDDILLAKVRVVRRIAEAESEVRTQRDELEKINEELKEADRIKSDFLAIMSHEIRTPMNGILGYAQLLEKSNLDEEQTQNLDIITGSCRRLLDLLNNILDFSKLESQGVELKSALFSIEVTVMEALDLLLVKAKEKGINLEYEIDELASGLFRGDAQRLRQVIINLVSNAIKFTDQGRVMVSVKGNDLGDGQREISFRVEDTGVGIPADKLDRLFKPFSQIETAAKKTDAGTGLGLVISQRIVEKMGGEINVESEVGKGTAFFFNITLPGK